MRFLLLLALLPLASYGQDTEHIQRGYVAQPELQAELAPNDHSYVNVAVGGLRYSDFNNVVVNRTLGLDVRYLTAGYEQRFGASAWSWGATARLAGETGTTLLQPGLLLRHRGALGPLAFGQRLGVEYAFSDNVRLNPAYELVPAYYATSHTLVRLRLDLQLRDGLALGEALRLRPRLSFEPAVFLRLQKTDSDPEKRTIDFTSLRGELAFSLATTGLDLTPWFAFQTQYLRTLIQTDQYGNPTSNGKLNSRLPTVGLELRYRLGRKTVAEEGFVLPTQH